MIFCPRPDMELDKVVVFAFLMLPGHVVDPVSLPGLASRSIRPANNLARCSLQHLPLQSKEGLASRTHYGHPGQTRLDLLGILCRISRNRHIETRPFLSLKCSLRAVTYTVRKDDSHHLCHVSYALMNSFA
jgi:hypothetical protein